MSDGPSRRDRIRDTVRYYRTVAPHIEREQSDRSDREFWSGVAREHPGADVLEVGCGTGRVTRVFARQAARVAGVDLSPDMLRRARREFSRCTAVRLIRGDVLHLPLRPGFDLAVAANGVFSHLLRDVPRRRAIDQVARALRPGGSFLLDAFWLTPERRSRCARPDGDRRVRRLGDGPRHLRIVEHWTRDPGSARCRVRYRYEHPDGTVDEAESVLRFWTVDELRLLLRDAGLRTTAEWGGYDRSGWTPDARRLVVRARRPE